MLLLPKISWPRAIAWTRSALAALALVTSFLFTSPGESQLIYAVLGVYLAYSLLVALRSRSHTGMLGLLAIFGDTVYFLMMASYGGDNLLWIASFFFLFMMTETLVFYSTVEVVVIVAVSALFCVSVTVMDCVPLFRRVV